MQFLRKFTKEQEQQICKDYFSDEKLSSIILSKKWNCSDVTIRNIVRRSGHNPRTISEAHIGKKTWNIGLTKETSEGVKRISDSKKGKKRSEETKRKISEKNRGKKHPHSEETKRKIGDGNRHKKSPLSEQHKINISNSLKGHIVTEETKQKISNSHKGKIFSEDHIRKINEGKAKAKYRSK